MTEVYVRSTVAMRRMRCPAIEGIETRSSCPRRGRRPARVECVAPLLRGLKHMPVHMDTATLLSKVECVAPLLRGLKPGKRPAGRHRRSASRMRCPAIEGIETRPSADGHAKRGSMVECVAPLLRGLKRGDLVGGRRLGQPRRMRCPAIEGIETRNRPDRDDPRPCRSNALPRY